MLAALLLFACFKPAEPLPPSPPPPPPPPVWEVSEPEPGDAGKSYSLRSESPLPWLPGVRVFDRLHLVCEGKKATQRVYLFLGGDTPLNPLPVVFDNGATSDARYVNTKTNNHGMLVIDGAFIDAVVEHEGWKLRVAALTPSRAQREASWDLAGVKATVEAFRASCKRR